MLTVGIAQAETQGDILHPGMTEKDIISSVKAMETSDGFSAQFWITTDEQVFVSWSQNTAIRELKPITEVKRNTPVYLALFMANPGVRRKSMSATSGRKISDVTFDLFIINPNGTLTLSNKQKVGWRGLPPAPQLVYLAQDRGTLNFETIDPLGEYTIVLIVHDNVRKVDMRLIRTLKLVD